MAHVPGGPPNGRPDRTPIWTTLITVAGTVFGSILTFAGVLYATDSRIERGAPTPGPTVTVTQTVDRSSSPAPTVTVTETAPGGGGVGAGSTPEPGEPSPSKTALDVTWDTDIREYENDTNLTVLFDCPARGVVQEIYGDHLYSAYSSVCTAGVHDGRITLAKGGRLTVLIREGAREYPSARRNGIKSEEKASSPASFEFLPPR